MEPTDPLKLADHLERLIAGLEQTRESLKFEIPYYKPDDLQGRYAQKFLVSIEGQIAQSKARLEELKKTLPPASKPEGQ